MNNSGFTLIELIIVIIIIGILATFAIPNYSKYFERMRSKSAQNNLLVIYDKEKRYRLDNGAYYICPSPCTLAVINAGLELDLVDPYFTYNIALRGTTGYKATATRNNVKSTLCPSPNNKIRINDTGTGTRPDSSLIWTDACPYWQ